LCFFFYFSLRDRTQVEQLLRYIIEEPQEDAENKRVFKYAVVIEILLQKGYVSTLLFPFYHLIIVIWFRFPFIACEIFTCEIDVILKTLVDEEEVCSILHYSLHSLFFCLKSYINALLKWISVYYCCYCSSWTYYFPSWHLIVLIVPYWLGTLARYTLLVILNF